MSLIPKTVYDPNLPINQEEAQHAVDTGTYEDDPALRLVVMDTIRAENFAATKAWLLFHPQASILYQSPFTPRYWEGSTTPRADVPFFTVAIAVNSLVPKVMQGLFYESPPFMIQKRPKTKDEAARAVGALIGYQLEDINFRTQVELGVRNAILFGTGIWKWGWETFTRERTVYERKTPSLTIPNPLASLGGDKSFDLQNDEDIEEVIYQENIDRPYFENITNLREVLVDPGLNVPDIQKAKYVVHRLYLTYKDLDKLRQTPGYDIPSEETVLGWFLPPIEEPQPAMNETAARNPLYDARSDPRYVDTTADILNHPLEVLERWDNDNVTVVVQKKLVICNQRNPYGKIPFLSVGWWDVPEAFWSMGLAKAQPLDAKILTPSGWKLMGEMSIGDEVIGSDGKPHKVTGVFPQGEKEVFKVTFTDGSSTECTKEHLWTIETPLSKRSDRRGWKTKTYELQDFCDKLKSSNGNSRYFIPVSEPVEFSTADLPLDPYLLGLLIGDGGLTAETPKFTTADTELVEAVSKVLPEGMYIAGVPKSRYDYKIVSVDHKCNKVLRAIKYLGLNCLSPNKFIPNVYKFSSIEQRKALLAGLIDSDGTAGKNGCASFGSSSERLRNDVIFLVQSLGGVASKPDGVKTQSDNMCYRTTIGLSFNPFRLERKRQRYIPRTKYKPTRGFESVEFVGIKPCQCIMVDVPDHLYLTDDCIVTHNTIGAEQRLQKGITDTWLDNAAINLSGTYVRTLGKGQQSQSIRISPGKIVNIEEGGKFDPLKRLDPVPEAAQHIAMSQARVELTSGANEVTAQGIAGNAAHSNMARSAAGSNMIGAGADSRPQDFVEKFVNQVFIPFLYHVHEMDRALLPKETIKYILDEELEHEYFATGGDLIELLNAGVKFSVLAGSKMQARKQMASTLPIIVQLLTNDQTLQHLALQNKKVDFNAIFTSMLEVSGWKTKSDWILEMTPEEKQKAQMNTPAAQMQMKLQAGQQQDKVKQSHKLELIQSENEARAAREVLRHALEVSETPETLMGMPNTQGFGSQ